MSLAEPPLTTLTLFHFPPRARPWAFVQMGIAPRSLARVRGLRFWRLVGSGRGVGFSLRPDFGRYGLLAVWDDAAAADAFFAGAPVLDAYRQRADEAWTVRLRTLHAHGAWGGVNPFIAVGAAAAGARSDGERAAAGGDRAGPVAVLTRATLRWRRLAAFWGAVPSASRAVEAAPGLLGSIGIGEVPYLRQATFSLWRSEADVRAYAYAGTAHRAVIQRTRDEGWYAEELFARFRPLSTEGTWNGRDPLALPGGGEAASSPRSPIPRAAGHRAR